MFNRQAQTMILVLLCALGSNQVFAQTEITTPFEQLGFKWVTTTGSPATHSWRLIGSGASESDRMALEVIGATAEGCPIYMEIITSAENHEKLNRYKDISRRLALAEGVSEAEARELAA